MGIISSVPTSSSYTNTSTTQSSSEITVPTNLTKYLSDTKSHSKKLDSAIKTLCQETDDDKLKDATETFIKYYNKVIKDNSTYDDKGLQSLTKKLKSFVDEKSSTLSTFGITIQNSGKLKVDESKLKTAISDDDNSFSTFISSNKDSNGLFYNLENLVKELKKDNTYYLSDNTKKIIGSVNTNTSTSSSSSTSSTSNNIVDSYA